jgi:hypothetical protein
MKTIKFNNNYPKLWNQKKATLLKVEIILKENIPKEFVEYDCKKSNGTYFELEGDRFLLLTFRGENYIPFSTLRKLDDYEKLFEYGNLINNEFEIIIEETSD